jgi:hypothetical protein
MTLVLGKGTAAYLLFLRFLRDEERREESWIASAPAVPALKCWARFLPSLRDGRGKIEEISV